MYGFVNMDPDALGSNFLSLTNSYSYQPKSYNFSSLNVLIFEIKKYMYNLLHMDP